MRLQIHRADMDPKPDHDTVLITGDGRSLIADLEAFESLNIPCDVMAIGRSINVIMRHVKHWANVDGPECIWWAEHLPLKNDGKMPIRHTLGDCRGYDIDWDIMDDVVWGKDDKVLWHGSTSLFAVYASLALSYSKIYLAGCPMDLNGHWFSNQQDPPVIWNGEDFVAWLEFAKTEEAKKVYSFSGYTRQILGSNGYGGIY